MEFNNKGMTLIELLVAIVVLSIACLMSATGVTAIISRMSEGAEIKKATNTIVSAIDGDSSSTEYKDILNVKTGMAQLKLDDGTTLVTNGTMYEGKIVYGNGDNDSVNLSRYSAQEIVMTDNEKTAYTMYTLINNPPLTIEWYNSLSKEDKDKIAQETGLEDPALKGPWNNQFVDKNERFLQYVALTYYYKLDASGKRVTNWTVLDISKMYYINPIKPGERVTIKDTAINYIMPYFSNDNNITNGVNIIFCRRDKNDYGNGSWNVKFVFNDLDNHWYYNAKNTPSINALVNADSKEKAITVLNNFKQKLLNQEDGWYRVYEN